MEQKHFYQAFDLLYQSSAPKNGITSKEAFYILLFRSVDEAIDENCDTDAIRRITSGKSNLRLQTAKTLQTTEGFEQLRKAVEKYTIQDTLDTDQTFFKLLNIVREDRNIPGTVKLLITDNAFDSTYTLSRAITASLICLNYSDYMVRTGTEQFIDVVVMRLYDEAPLAEYPKYLTDYPSAGVEELVGREDELDTLYNSMEKSSHILISAVGGLGKTELAKALLERIHHTHVSEHTIEYLAWIPYDNHNLCLSIKQAFGMEGDEDDVWNEMQYKAEAYRERLLLVIDNIEKPEDDAWLNQLGSLPCRIIATSRQRKLRGFAHTLDLLPLSAEQCRILFYYHYKDLDKNDEALSDIIALTARLTIMVVFIAKAAYLEGIDLYSLYRKLVEKGFRLSEEDVSCEHEKMQNDETIIRQMCILFSLVQFTEEDKTVLTYISAIPTLPFSFDKAKSWFNIKKNIVLMRLFNVGMLEHSIEQRKHIYWMHSVIAAAIREQQKAVLYDTVSSFMYKISEELEYGDNWGKGYTKIELIPFSWSVADIMEEHLGNEDDATFLLRLFYVCYDASNYPICRKLIEKVLEIDQSLGNKEALIRDCKNYGDYLLRIDDAENALVQYDKAQKYMHEIDPEQKHLLEWAYLWHKYGNYYYHIGNPGKALDYYYDALEIDEKIPELPPRELATDYASIAEIYKEYGDLNGAYDMLTKAIQTDDIDEEDSENIMLYFYMATLCSSYVNLGYYEYIDEGERCFQKVIAFREKYFDKNCHDLADAYLEYANFCKDIGNYEKATDYCQQAASIYQNLYGEFSYHMLQCKSTHALILSESNHVPEAIDLYRDIIEKAENISNYPPTDLCRDYQNFADILENAAQYNEAEIYYTKAISLVKQVYAEDSPNLAQLYLDYANCLMGKEQYKTAIYNLKQLEQFTEDDSLLKRVMEHKLGTCYCLLNDYPKSVKHLLNAAELCKQNPNGTTDIGYIAVDLCNVYQRMEETDSAEQYRQIAYETAMQYPKDADLNSYVHTLDISEPDN